MDRTSTVEKDGCRKAHDKYISDLLSPNHEHGNKRFWSYIKTKRKDQCSVPSLEVNHQTISDSQSKANILNDQFTSVFTTDSTTNRVANLVGQPYPTIPSVQVNVNGIINLLRNLKPHKAPGPDGIPPRFLRDMATSIAPILTIIFQASLNFLMFGKQLQLHPYLRKAHVLIHLITDQSL